MAKRLKAVIQLRRGKAAEWEEVNPVLRLAEPGFVTDTGELKIGDGITAWKDLEVVNESGVVSAATHIEFPPVGKSEVLYKATAEKLIYQWDDTDLKYVPMSSGPVSVENLNIDIISGGNANVE